MATTRHRVTFDLRDHPRLLKAVKTLGGRQRTTQKAIVVDALTAYLSQRQKSHALLLVAEKNFADWENDEDEVYDTR